MIVLIVIDVAQKQFVFTVTKFTTIEALVGKGKKSIGHVAEVFCTIISYSTVILLCDSKRKFGCNDTRKIDLFPIVFTSYISINCMNDS